MSFGSRFKKLLDKHQIKQSQFSRETGTHPGLVSRYINGENPSGDFIMKAVAYFPNEITYLFLGDESSVQEEAATYNVSPSKIIDEIHKKLDELEKICHKIDTK